MAVFRFWRVLSATFSGTFKYQFADVSLNMFDLILFSACSVSALAWLILLFMPIRWRMAERWEAAGASPAAISRWPRLSVIVPARNERASLPATLPSWLNQDYPESEIVLVDDTSSDGTAECAREIAARFRREVRVINGVKPPPGWTGKLWALQQGIDASTGEWLLFTDADIYHSPNLWRGLVSKALAEQRAMVSLMALLDTSGGWARLLIPAFVYFFYLLYPFKKVGDVHSRMSAAAGGCILISRYALDRIGGLAGHRDAWIDDLALARRVKGAGMPLSLSLTRSAVSIRPYHKLGDIWGMVARNAFSQLRCSWPALFGTVVGLSVLFIAPVAGICVSLGRAAVPSITAMVSIGAIIFMAGTYVPMIRFFKLGIHRAFTLPLAGTLYVAMTVTSAFNHLTGRRQWRGSRIETS